jgi:hypothetical protein
MVKEYPMTDSLTLINFGKRIEVLEGPELLG